MTLRYILIIYVAYVTCELFENKSPWTVVIT